MSSRVCAWCRGAIPAGARADAVWCSKPCRQAAHRASVRRSSAQLALEPKRLAYADPPYPGKADLYADHPDYAGEVDHLELVRRLTGGDYDGWALCTSAAALPLVLGLVAGLEARPFRVAAWVRGAHPHATARVVNAWEPVIVCPARSLRDPRDASPVLDTMGAAPRRRATLPTWVIGAKPPAVAEWTFRLMGARPGDELEDLYPGSGLVLRTFRLWSGLAPHRTGEEGWQLPAPLE